MPLSTQLAERYRLHLIHLRTLTRMCLDGAQERAMLEAIDDLADTLMAGGPSVVQVEIPVPAEQVGADIEAARAELGIVGLLDDTEPMLSAARDNRVSEVA